MDDFGSGYSSLNMLGEMSLDILKLDMKFIRNQMAKPAERSLLKSIVEMAHTLDLKAVAEGVETEEQRDRLKSISCDYAQGYFYAKPTPAADYEKLLQRLPLTRRTDILHKGIMLLKASDNVALKGELYENQKNRKCAAFDRNGSRNSGRLQRQNRSGNRNPDCGR